LTANQNLKTQIEQIKIQQPYINTINTYNNNNSYTNRYNNNYNKSPYNNESESFNSCRPSSSKSHSCKSYSISIVSDTRPFDKEKVNNFSSNMLINKINKDDIQQPYYLTYTNSSDDFFKNAKNSCSKYKEENNFNNNNNNNNNYNKKYYKYYKYVKDQICETNPNIENEPVISNPSEIFVNDDEICVIPFEKSNLAAKFEMEYGIMLGDDRKHNCAVVVMNMNEVKRRQLNITI